MELIEILLERFSDIKEKSKCHHEDAHEGEHDDHEHDSHQDKQ